MWKFVGGDGAGGVITNSTQQSDIECLIVSVENFEANTKANSQCLWKALPSGLAIRNCFQTHWVTSTTKALICPADLTLMTKLKIAVEKIVAAQGSNYAFSFRFRRARPCGYIINVHIQVGKPFTVTTTR